MTAQRVAVGCLVAAGISLSWAQARKPARGVVAADHPLASAAGMEVLDAGGNAVDAAIAATLASGVVQPSGSGLGGGGFALVARAGEPPLALDFREVAPASGSREMFLSGASSQKGGASVAVPSEGIGLAELHRRKGKLSLKKIAAPAIRLATEGFTPGAHLLHALDGAPGMKALYDEAWRRPRLAAALKSWVDTEGESFRSGWVAQDFVDSARAAGGGLTLADLQGYQVKERAPLSGRYKGFGVLTFPPPSSGGVALLQMLGATEGSGSAHCAVEAAKHAMAWRAVYGADPDFAPVPTDALLAPSLIDGIRADCGARTWPAGHYAPPMYTPKDAGTLHISVVDSAGGAVALTSTINTSFGSKVIAAKSGIVLNNEMDDFTTRPGVANVFGLMQGEGNTIAPGKRPLSSMTPTILLSASGEPVMAVGASGGPFIITATYQVIQDIVEGGMDPSAAVALPRWHHQWMPDVVMVEPTYTGKAVLEASGHVLQEVQGFSAVQVAMKRVTPEGEVFAGASDPRKGGEAAVRP